MRPLKAEAVQTHLGELNRCIRSIVLIYVIAFGIAYYYSTPLFHFLVAPYLRTQPTHPMIYTGMTEAFLTYMRVAFYAAFVFSFPFITYCIFRFVSPGLYRTERQLFIALTIAGSILFLQGMCLAYYGVIPLAWSFFASFESPLSSSAMPLLLEPRMSEYLSLTLSFLIGFGLVFEMPLVLLCLVTFQWVKVAQLVKARRYVIVGIFVIAAILTPPDILSQICLAVPMLLFYELSIIVGRLIERKGRNA